MSFNRTVRQITEMFQLPKCLSKNMTEMSQAKKTGVGNTRKEQILKTNTRSATVIFHHA